MELQKKMGYLPEKIKIAGILVMKRIPAIFAFLWTVSGVILFWKTRGEVFSLLSYKPFRDKIKTVYKFCFYY
ncbi:hypothetical protein H9X84_10510 [Anaerotignum lactatifermentans]|nr:hypothetical protein [Anaerotignum lactatifermentans]